MNKIPLLVILGPTGIGKSALAQQLALILDSAVIHADSRQVYKHMDIGTAKPSPAMRRQLPHYLLDVVEPDEPFNAGRYRELASPLIETLWRCQGKLPIVEGGSGLYIKALVDGLFEGPAADERIRRRLKKLAQEKGAAYLHRQLSEVDPASAARLHPNDTPRLIRALEVLELTGKPLSLLQGRIPPSPYTPIFFGLNTERRLLYRWIEERVQKMLQQGLLEEVEWLLARGYEENLSSMRGLGYKQVAGYLRGEYGLEQALYLLKRDTRRYAKRQLTWFRRDERIRWLEVSHPSRIEELIPPILATLSSLQLPAGGA